jgi:hypothetical protein
MNLIATGAALPSDPLRLGGWWTRSSFAIACALPFARSFAEDRVDYRYEDYSEDGGRIHIQTHAALFSKEIRPWLNLRGSFVYDGISGATPIGAPPLPGETTVKKVNIDDIRRAGFIEPSFKIENHTLTPQFAISEESDYESLSASLSHSIDFNEKNTTFRHQPSIRSRSAERGRVNYRVDAERHD